MVSHRIVRIIGTNPRRNYTCSVLTNRRKSFVVPFSAVPCPPNWAVRTSGRCGGIKRSGRRGNSGPRWARSSAGIPGRWQHETVNLIQLPAALLLTRNSVDANMRQVLVALLLVAFAQGHGGHDGPAKGETIQQYAQRHVCLLAHDV